MMIIGSSFLGQPALAQTLNKAGVSFPVLTLPQQAKGPNIPVALGPNLHAIANWYGHTDAEFTALCNRDKSMVADRQGRLGYACDAPTAMQGSSTAWGNTGTTITAPYADSQTFLLHSKPGASKVIYLDFDGNTTSGTSWNTSYTAGANIVTAPYDIDAKPGSFSTSELANIQVIWQSVAEDFAAFDVDVTTQDPGIEALRKTSTSDTVYGKRVCIGGSSMDWYGVSAGGVAYLNSFNWNTDTPAFVFPAQLGPGNPKFVAEAAAHETGHTFGLHHDGVTGGTEYYQGQGTWAPIMGASYYVNVTQWCKGEYTNANNTEDQVALISALLPRRADAVGNDTAHATALTGTPFSASNFIEVNGDVDVFSFTTGTGNVSLTAKPAAPVSGDVNLLLSLYNSSGAVITSAGPTASSTGVTIGTSLAAGTYYLAVNGVASGSPTSTGYSDYGNIGQFSITGSVVPATNKAPTAVASSSAPVTGIAPLAVAFSSAGSSDSDGTIASYSWNFGDGTTSTVANPSHTYATVGTFTATLTVKDNFGVASAPVSVTITANSAPYVYISALTITKTKGTKGTYATVTATVKDQTGALKSAATVAGTWSGGLVSGTASGRTSTSGTIALKSAATTKTGTITFTVTGVTLSGYTYSSAKNVNSSISIAVP